MFFVASILTKNMNCTSTNYFALRTPVHVFFKAVFELNKENQVL